MGKISGNESMAHVMDMPQRASMDMPKNQQSNMQSMLAAMDAQQAQQQAQQQSQQQSQQPQQYGQQMGAIDESRVLRIRGMPAAGAQTQLANAPPSQQDMMNMIVGKQANPNNYTMQDVLRGLPRQAQQVAPYAQESLGRSQQMQNANQRGMGLSYDQYMLNQNEPAMAYPSREV